MPSQKRTPRHLERALTLEQTDRMSAAEIFARGLEWRAAADRFVGKRRIPRRHGKHGGWRPRAGRKRVAARPRVPHRVRPLHLDLQPMHITLRLRSGLPSLRSERVRNLVVALIAKANGDDFQIVHWSIQGNHLHFVAEADGRDAVIRKMQGFAIAFAKRLNKHVLGGRRGKVFADRYHRRDVEGARDLRNVLVYVFGNAKKHGHIARDAAVADPYSNACHFDGWDVAITPPRGADRWPRARPRTRMLRDRWWSARGAPLKITEAPRRG